MQELNSKPVIDISWWQDPEKINYDKLAPAISGAIIRLGYGSNQTGVPREDNRFRRHYDEFRKRRVPVGAYWYSTAISEEEVQAELDETLRICEGLEFGYPIAWDTEDPRQSQLSPEVLTRLARIYCGGLVEAGYHPMIYSYSWWLDNRMKMEDLEEFDVWVASLAPVPEYRREYKMWQWTWSLSLPGYDGPLDGNRAYFDYPGFMRERGLNGFERPLPPEPKPYAFSSPYRAGMKIQGYTKPFWKGDLAPIKRPGELIQPVLRVDLGGNSFVQDEENQSWYLVQSLGRWQVSDARERPIHIVRKGDSLWSIAREYLGDGKRWTELAEINRMENPNRLVVGEVIRLPFK